ncbi:unnamed protein product [Phytophthora fragariaefolia]|uniref:Unnamed protein product n=1 Tax=Phytophthora fragariaefolia TaxID=1490495 RepID=A0A9W6XI22_9STRA|nr:unnamed protein product [Phytophthora fragariaefolia]
MASIAPSIPDQCDSSFTRDRNQSARTKTWARASGWQEALTQPDIGQCIALSKIRCVFTVVSLALLLTDIPRTGLGVRSLREFYPLQLLPSTAVRFGPFDYPVIHVWCQDNASSEPSGSNFTEFAGMKGDRIVSGARVWPYQYDTLSVGFRGAVDLLNVTKFPSFLLYKPKKGEAEKNAESLIDLTTTFTMLDDFMTSARIKLRPLGNESTVLRYATKHNWIDRIHHYVVQFASTNPAWRLHSLHTPHITNTTHALAICSNAVATKHSPLRPRFCNHPGIWKVNNPMNTSLPPVRLWDHMDLRFQAFKNLYPDLVLDVVLLSSQRLSATSGLLQTTYYNYEALEIVVLTRGRRCMSIKGNWSYPQTGDACTTVFVDDYRYESDRVQTNLVDWYAIIAFLRGGAQAYVWLRLLLLVYGAYVVAGQPVASKRVSDSLLMRTLLILFKIPFEVIVYSSLLPVSGYVLALLLDSSFMDIFLDSFWAAVGGSINIGLVSFLRSTAVQMRNVWLLAFLVSLAVYGVKRSRDYWGDGIPAVRGLVICFTSALTVFGPYKKTTYRDTNIMTLFEIANEGQIMDIIHSNPAGYYNISNYFFDDSAVMLMFCINAVILCAVMIKSLNYLISQGRRNHERSRGIIFSITPMVPCGAHRLWVTSVLSIQFYVPARVLVGAKSDSSRTASSSGAKYEDSPPQTKVRPFNSQLLPKIPSRSATTKRHLLGGEDYNSIEFRSILQLMNIAMFTDPLNFFWLRVLGIPMYLYRIRAIPLRSLDTHSSRFYTVILPYCIDEMEEHVGLGMKDFQLLDSASSRDIPLSVLLQSG